MKILTGFVAAAVAAGSLAVPADARGYGRWRHHDRVDAGDVLAGAAIIGGILAIASAAGRNRRDAYYARKESPYRAAVNSCGYEADEAYGRGNVRVTDVRQVDEHYFRVEGVVDRGGGYFGRDEARAGEPDEVVSEERYYDPEARRRSAEPVREPVREEAGSFTFACTASGDGRIADFEVRG